MIDEEQYKGWTIRTWFMLGYGFNGYAEHPTETIIRPRSDGYESQGALVRELKKKIDALE